MSKPIKGYAMKFIVFLFCVSSLVGMDDVPKINTSKVRNHRFVWSSDDVASHIMTFRAKLKAAADKIAEAEKDKFDQELNKSRDYFNQSFSSLPELHEHEKNNEDDNK